MARRPPNDEFVDLLIFSEAKVDVVGGLGTIRIQGKLVPVDVAAPYFGGKTSSDAESVARCSSQPESEIISAWQAVLVNPERCSADLAHNEVHLTGAPKICCYHRSAVPITVCAGETADFQERLSAEVEEDAIALKAAQVVLEVDLKRIFDPELAEFGVDVSRLFTGCGAIEGL
jgi:hypothetical protein